MMPVDGSQTIKVKQAPSKGWGQRDATRNPMEWHSYAVVVEVSHHGGLITALSRQSEARTGQDGRGSTGQDRTVPSTG
jgi:hypothetical protein